MHITQLGYVGIAALDIEAWQAFAGDFLGMQVVKNTGCGLALRMDERWQRMLIEASDYDGLAFVGFEVADAHALHDAVAEMTNNGIDIHAGVATECRLRQVSEFFWFRDPDGYRIELYYGSAKADQPFIAARPIGGFRTGDLGIGHVVLQTSNFSAMEDFYQRTLGFRISDFIEAKPFRASFLHVNPRHHSFAIIASPEKRLHHIMVEYNYMDDVGRLYDMALTEPGRVSVTLGRHSNDHVLSFYSKTPGGFMIETGWAGRLIDEQNWTPEALYGPSIWGHERSWLPAEAQASARRQREAAAQQGVLEPTEVVSSQAFKLNNS